MVETVLRLLMWVLTEMLRDWATACVDLAAELLMDGVVVSRAYGFVFCCNASNYLVPITFTAMAATEFRTLDGFLSLLDHLRAIVINDLPRELSVELGDPA